jgi:chromatin segregation and condensation protein Rec8/ScpA/Scc1 (kleisin family)
MYFLIYRRSAMARPSVIVASLLGLIASPTLLPTITTPAAAQEQEWIAGDQNDGDLRDLLRDWVQDRPDRRDMLMDLVQDRRDDRRDRRAELVDRFRDRRDMRRSLRDRISNNNDDEEDDGSLRDRLRERVAERRSGNCYFLTRSLRNEDQSLLVLVRRQICRD